MRFQIYHRSQTLVQVRADDPRVGAEFLKFVFCDAVQHGAPSVPFLSRLLMTPPRSSQRRESSRLTYIKQKNTYFIMECLLFLWSCAIWCMREAVPFVSFPHTSTPLPPPQKKKKIKQRPRPPSPATPISPAGSQAANVA